MRIAAVHGRRRERLRALLSLGAVVTGTWLSGVVDGQATGAGADEATWDLEGVRTWVVESPVVVAWSEEPVVSSFDLRCPAPNQEGRRAPA